MVLHSGGPRPEKAQLSGRNPLVLGRMSNDPCLGLHPVSVRSVSVSRLPVLRNEIA